MGGACRRKGWFLVQGGVGGVGLLGFISGLSEPDRGLASILKNMAIEI